MKRLLLLTIALMITTSVAAQTATQEATPTGTNLDDLKERLATKVAELRQTQKKAIYGTVKVTSVSTITVETATSDVKIELTDEIKVAQVVKGKRTELTTEDLAKGDKVTVFGDYDANLELLRAQAIFIQGPLPTHIAGTITETDVKAFTITVQTTQGTTYTVDYEKTTKTTLWTREKGTAKGSFSRLVAGDSVHILGTPDSKEDNRLTAARILDIGNLTGAPTATPTPEKESSPSATPTP